jgi:hypothetical protein
MQTASFDRAKAGGALGNSMTKVALGAEGGGVIEFLRSYSPSHIVSISKTLFRLYGAPDSSRKVL